MSTGTTPAQLSTPLTAWRGAMRVPHLVIGSGYGGAVAALRLAEAGHEVLVLERGSEYLPGDFPNTLAELPKHVRAPSLRGSGTMGSAAGVFDWHAGGQVVALVGNGVGGGSLINAGVALAPDDDVLRQPCWPGPIRHDTDPRGLDIGSAIERARQALGAQPGPDPGALPKTRALARLAPFLQPGAVLQSVPLTIDAEHCTRCGDCATGCNVPGAKLTLRDTYLARAAAAGARILTGATAYSLRPQAGGGWTVTVLPTERIASHRRPADAAASSDARHFFAAEVFVAAGTFGSTELLQRSQALAGTAFPISPTLGSRFSGNGDALGFVVDSPQPVHAEGHGALAGRPDVGPTITGVVDLRRHGSGRRQGELRPLAERLVVEDGATPGAIATLAREMHGSAYALQQLDHFGWRVPRAATGMDPLSADALAGHTQVLLTMGHDGAAGRIVRLPERDASVPYWPRDPAQEDCYRRQAEVFAHVGEAGGVHLHPPTWQLLPRSAEAAMSGPQAPRALLTVHPLGGCPMGEDFDSGVVDHRGRAWRAPGERWPGLHVLDGSIVPSSLGVNPMLTITALAERALAWWVHENGRGPARPPAAVPGTAARGAATGGAPGAPSAPTLTQPTTYAVSLFERLTASAAQWQAPAPWQHAELRLELGADDWMQVWRDPLHRVALQRGHLRLDGPVGSQGQAPTSVHYDVVDGSFELLSSGHLPFARHAARPRARPAGTLRRMLAAAVRQVESWLTAIWVVLARQSLLWTWLAQRGLDDIGRTLRDGRSRQGGVAYALSLARSLVHAAERRQMNYTLRLRRVGPGETPAELTLVGRKHIGYGAGVRALRRWARDHGAQARQGQGVPPPRPTFWEQITNPTIVLLAGQPPAWQRWLAANVPALSGAWARGRFQLDPAEMIAQAPLLLQRGDLSEGLVAQGAYPAQFLRYALKTHLFDFRLPDYSGQVVVDDAGTGEPVRVGQTEITPERHRLTVRRGRSEGEPKTLRLPTTLELLLWHYRAPGRDKAALLDDHWYGLPVRRARAVLLLHAFGQSGGMFTLPELKPNLAATLLEAGLDVWVLDHRISTRLPYTGWPSTIDQIARWDVPAAVDRMLEVLQDEHGVGAPIQVFAMGQCIGGAALAMSLLSGRLSHDLPAAGPAGELPTLLPKLAGAVISQTHPIVVGTPITRAKTWVPHLLQNLLPGGAVPLAVRAPVTSVAEAWLDRVFASLPVPENEHCPEERDAGRHQDDCATCRRIRFIEAPLFKHANLSAAVHRALPRLFGPANLHLFAHAATCVEHERLVDNDARPVYVHDERLRRHCGLPIAFLHGHDNELFHRASAWRSAKQWQRLFPDLQAQVQASLGAALVDGAWVVPGFGHVDVIIGQDAPQKIFAPMARLFDALWQRREPGTQAPALQHHATARPPRSGPWIGATQWLGGGRLRLRLAFVVDDRFTEAKGGSDAPPGTRTWAFVRAGRGRHATLHPLALHVVQPTPDAAPGLRIAHGEITVTLPPRGPGARAAELALPLRGVTIHEALAAQGQPLDPEFLPLPADPPWASAPADERRLWVEKAMQARVRAARAAARRTNWIDPQWRNTSPQRREGRAQVQAKAQLSARQLARFEHPQALRFAAASCRYPGMAVDGERVDNAARALLERARRGQVHLAFLLGDQIYADATAGLADSANPVERFVLRHLGALDHHRPPWLAHQRTRQADLLASLPVYQAQDDHEYRDGWPGSGPLEKGEQQGRARDNRVVRIAREAAQAFQNLHMPDRIGAGMSYAFDDGPARFFVADTRNERRVQPVPRILDRRTRIRLRTWLQDQAGESQLNVIVSGTVLLPRLAPGRNPGNPGEDTWAWSARERRWLLGLLRRAATMHRPRRFLLLAGDYHLCAAARIEHAGRVIGAAVVSPPLYAPLAYTNTVPSSLWFNEPLPGLAMAGGVHFEGSGFVQLGVRRVGSGFVLRLQPQLQDHLRGDAAIAPRPMHRIHLP